MATCLLFDDWYAAKCAKVSGHRVRFSELHADYQAFLVGRGFGNALWQGSAKAFSPCVLAKGHRRFKSNGVRYFVDIALTQPAAQATAGIEEL